MAILRSLLTLYGAGAQSPPRGDRYPDWKGQWMRTDNRGASWDQTKPRGQQAPLRPEYQAEFEEAGANRRNGRHGGNRPRCASRPGLPRALILYSPWKS